MRKQFWIWPVIAAVVLAAIGLTIRLVVEQSVKDSLAANLETMLTVDIEALQTWLQAQKSNATALAGNSQVAELIDKIVTQAATDTTDSELVTSPHLSELRQVLTPWLAAYNYHGFAVVTRESRILASELDEPIGKSTLPIQSGLLEQVFRLKSVVTRPFESALLLEDKQGNTRAGLPTMFAVAPVLDGQGRMYMSPEAIENAELVDARSDLYAVGGLGYFLLTGNTVFDGNSVVQICNQQVNEAPRTPSERLGREVDLDLEAILLKCLEKSPQDRPQNAAELNDALAQCESAGSWTQRLAADWWDKAARSPALQLTQVATDTPGDAPTILPDPS